MSGRTFLLIDTRGGNSKIRGGKGLFSPWCLSCAKGFLALLKGLKRDRSQGESKGKGE